MRLDKELVRRGFFTSRNKAVHEIVRGNIFCDDVKVVKPSFQVDETTEIVIKGTPLRFVSRGGLKLEQALNSFAISLHGKVCLDIGSSTGGFTDCALQYGARQVYAVDVGTAQMHEKLQKDNRVVLYEQTDIRDVAINDIAAVELAVIDVSFISVTKVVATLAKLPQISEVICLIKPQFESGRKVAKQHKGLILQKKHHRAAIEQVLEAFRVNNFIAQDLIGSPLRGSDGNVEFLAYLKKNGCVKGLDIVQERLNEIV